MNKHDEKDEKDAKEKVSGVAGRLYKIEQTLDDVRISTMVNNHFMTVISRTLFMILIITLSASLLLCVLTYMHIR